MKKEKKDEKSFDSVLEEFDVYFHQYFGTKLPVAFVQDLGWKPLTDVYETDSEFVVRIEVGGITQNDVSAHWEASSLVIRGKRNEEEKAATRTYHNIEITTGPFERRIVVPEKIVLEKESLRMIYRNGILEIRMRKVPVQGRAGGS